MGEVHVKVRLSNAADIELMERGLLQSTEVRTCEVEAFVDTGATRSILPPELVERLGLRIRRTAIGTLADGTQVPCGVCSGVLFQIEGRETLEEAYVMGDTPLVGQTVLQTTDLFVDCSNHRVVPNPAHPEGPVFRF